jgi:hypothetical protein
MRLKQEHARDVLSLESFEVGEQGEWHETTKEQSECGRWTGHDDRALEELDGDVWRIVRVKGVCISCGARRSDGAS